MKNLRDLLLNVQHEVYGNISNIVVDNLSHDSREIICNGLFFAMNGNTFAGEEYVVDAIKNGAVAVVSETEIETGAMPLIIVKNVRKAYSNMSATFYNNPSKSLICIGVIGTNGKTTCTKIIGDCLTKMGVKCATIGTLGCFIDGKKYITNMTTPDPQILNKLMAEIVAKGITHLVMEVSAHAIHLSKVEGIYFHTLLYTNITQDHLDYFKNMECYSNVKLNFFVGHGDYCVVNLDDKYAEKLIAMTDMKVITYSTISCADLHAKNINVNMLGQTFELFTEVDTIKINSRLNGRFNVYNLIGAIGTLQSLGFNLSEIATVIEGQLSAEGRFNMFNINGVKYIIDYAHTPDGLEKILTEAKSLANGNNLIVVFGCGGERDSEKRPIMGAIASSIADIIVVTEDNSRSENRQDIIDEIMKGVCDRKAKVFVCPDRKIAIAQAINIAIEGDVVVVAGKGAEDYIERKNEQIKHNDKEIVMSFANKSIKQ